jgi:hypothetical protein
MMPQIPRPVAYQVDIVECERGWGQRLEETLYFDTEDEALAYCDNFNKQNTQKTAPDWYMVANYQGRV